MFSFSLPHVLLDATFVGTPEMRVYDFGCMPSSTMLWNPKQQHFASAQEPEIKLADLISVAKQ